MFGLLPNRLYNCLTEFPLLLESWFEDFGTGRLECVTDVPLDPDFAALALFLDHRGAALMSQAQQSSRMQCHSAIHLHVARIVRWWRLGSIRRNGRP
jgi:hypothetical protein